MNLNNLSEAEIQEVRNRTEAAEKQDVFCVRMAKLEGNFYVAAKNRKDALKQLENKINRQEVLPDSIRKASLNELKIIAVRALTE